MGNQTSSAVGAPSILPKCPAPFVSVDAFACVMPCPSDKKFIRQGGANGYRCVYSPDNQVSVPLTTIGAAAFAGSTLDELTKADIARAREFTAEKDRFERELATAYANIDKSQKLADAFRDLQKAENARDQSPEAYQVARTAYYTLLKGPAWIQEERQRIARAEVEPIVRQYRSNAAQIANQSQQQARILDVVNGVKDRVVSLRDDFAYSTVTLSKQLEKVKSQIALDSRKRMIEPEQSAWTWVDGVLNVILAAALLYAAYILYRKVTTPKPVPQVAITGGRRMR